MRKLIIFDLDGTLLNTLSDMKNSMNHLFDYLNAPHITEDDMLLAMNKGRRYLIETNLNKSLTDEESERYQQIYHNHYFIHKNILTKPYDGINELLDKLKNDNYLLAICSNKLDNQTQGLVSEIFPNTFDYVIGSSKKYKRKPHNDMIDHIIKELNVKKTNIIYIGDTAADIIAAKSANIFNIAVLYGFGNKANILKENPNKTVNNANELYTVINERFI